MKIEMNCFKSMKKCSSK